jgi:hypothetical protein
MGDLSVQGMIPLIVLKGLDPLNCLKEPICRNEHAQKLLAN